VVAVAAAVVTISDPVALEFDVDWDIDTAHVADVDRIAAEMADSGAVDSVGYCSYRDIAADMTPEVSEEDRSNHSQLLGPMPHNFVRTAFAVAG